MDLTRIWVGDIGGRGSSVRREKVVSGADEGPVVWIAFILIVEYDSCGIIQRV